MKRPELSIVIPCLNEAETIGACIERARAALQRKGVDGEIVVADNGSTDGSIEIAGNLSARVVHVQPRGYGAALQAGISASIGEYVIFADGDGSYDFGQIDIFLNKLRAGYDVVVGNRFRNTGGTIEAGAMPWTHRYIGTPIISLLGRLFYGSRLSDFNCGMRGIRRAAFDSLGLRTNGMEFASEMIVRSTMHGLRIGEVPIHFSVAGRTRPPHLRTFRDGWRHLRYLLICSPKLLFFIPGGLLLGLGLVGMGLLLPGPFRFGSIGFDTNTFLVCAMMVLIGHQIISLGIIAKLFSMQHGLERPTARFLRLIARYDVEVGILVGLAMCIVGAALLTHGLLIWQSVSFGPLSYSESLRIVIPAVTMIMLGMQTLFNGFMFHIVLRTHS